jgi:twitching motility protein PilT
VADLDRYLRYLQRDDVDELVLQSGKVAALKLTSGKLHPLTKSPLGSGHIVSLLEGAGWGQLLPRQDTGGQTQTASSSGVEYRCRVARRQDQLQVRVLPAASEPQPAAKPRPAAKPQPASKPRAAAQPKPAAPQPSATDAAIASALASVESVRSSRGGAQTPSAPAPSSGAARSSRPPPRSGRASSGPAAAAVASGFDTRPPRCTWQNGSAEARLLALLREARESGCTDVHVVGGQPARLRRLSQLEGVGDPLPAAGVEQMLLPLMDQAGERPRAQLDELGYADFAVEIEGAGRLRVNFAKGQAGLKGCFRLVVPAPPSLDELGLPVELKKVAQYHQGLAVVSGPSGQGKTTTMAALVDLVNRSKPHHIITVEDPIEVVHPIRKAVISQRQVGLHTGSFHTALKGALREDPDVIIIGELRDRETVEMALQAAETGHLVIASMSTPSGAKTIDRLIDMFPPEDQAQVRSTLAGALKIVVSQRLVPTADRRKLVAAAELITGNVPLWSLIRENKLFQLSSLLQRGRNYGMIRAEDSLNELLAAGIIDEDTARAHADDPRAINPGGVKPQPAAGSGADAGPPNQDLGKAALGAMRSMFGRKKDGGQ